MKIPELLTTISGEKITDKEGWENFRRPEIMNLMSEYIYGVRPVERPDDLHFKTVRKEDGFGEKNILFEKTATRGNETLNGILQEGDVVLFENDLPDNYN